MSAGDGDARWMRAALSLARRGLGRVAPNPSVGAVLLKDGRVIGRGVTTAGGRPHAETVALAQAVERHGPDAARGATAYVTLEPCAHHGLTPPCADALIAAGVVRVVSPMRDPDPRVSGRGFARLAAAGVAVSTGICVEKATALNAGFLSRHVRGRPWLTLKLATTLDGRIATAAGESRWITGPAARARVHGMRARSDAVLVGGATALADDPMLNVRGHGDAVHHPVRIVADTRLALPLTHRLVETARQIPLWVLHAEAAEAPRAAALASRGAHTMAVPAGPSGLDLAAALDRLAAEGVTRVLCEGGGRLAAGLVAAGLVDEIALFGAGALLGSDARAGLGALGLDRLSDAPRFERAALGSTGADVFSLWRRPGWAEALAVPVTDL